MKDRGRIRRFTRPFFFWKRKVKGAQLAETRARMMLVEDKANESLYTTRKKTNKWVLVLKPKGKINEKKMNLDFNSTKEK